MVGYHLVYLLWLWNLPITGLCVRVTPHSSEIYIFLFISVGNRRSLWQWFHRGWRRMWLWYTRGEIKLNYSLAVFPKGRQTRKHCFVDNHVFQRWKTRRQSLLAMFPKDGILVQYFEIFFRTVSVLTTLAAIILHVCWMTKPNVLTEFAVVTARWGMNILLCAVTRNEWSCIGIIWQETCAKNGLICILNFISQRVGLDSSLYCKVTIFKFVFFAVVYR
jgi:hypothetical protein